MITLADVEKRYGTQTVIDGFSAVVNRGDKIVIVGHPASGTEEVLALLQKCGMAAAIKLNLPIQAQVQMSPLAGQLAHVVALLPAMQAMRSDLLQRIAGLGPGPVEVVVQPHRVDAELFAAQRAVQDLVVDVLKFVLHANLVPCRGAQGVPWCRAAAATSSPIQPAPTTTGSAAASRAGCRWRRPG